MVQSSSICRWDNPRKPENYINPLQYQMTFLSVLFCVCFSSTLRIWSGSGRMFCVFSSLWSRSDRTVLRAFFITLRIRSRSSRMFFTTRMPYVFHLMLCTFFTSGCCTFSPSPDCGHIFLHLMPYLINVHMDRRKLMTIVFLCSHIGMMFAFFWTPCS